MSAPFFGRGVEAKVQWRLECAVALVSICLICETGQPTNGIHLPRHKKWNSLKWLNRKNLLAEVWQFAFSFAPNSSCRLPQTPARTSSASAAASTRGRAGGSRVTWTGLGSGRVCVCVWGLSQRLHQAALKAGGRAATALPSTPEVSGECKPA